MSGEQNVIHVEDEAHECVTIVIRVDTRARLGCDESHLQQGLVHRAAPEIRAQRQGVQRRFELVT